MRLLVRFGLIDSDEIDWRKDLDQFPTIIKFLDRNYEWVLYDKDLTGRVDMILVYSVIPSYDPNFNVSCPLWSDISKTDQNDGCQCGAAHTSFGFDHMRFCKKWAKW